MNPTKIFLASGILAICAFSNAEDANDPVVKVVTQFGRQEFTPYSPHSDEVLRLFDLDKNGKITSDERDNIIQIIVELMPQIKTDALRTRLIERLAKHWDAIPTHMSFYLDESSPVISISFPPYPKFPNPDLPERIEVLTNPKNKRILVASSAEFPPRFAAPKPTIVDQLESPFQIKRRFDKNRDGKLDESEAKDLLLEMRFKFTLAKSNGARTRIIERYAEALEEYNTDEFEVSWGVDSTFKIFKDPMTGSWHADAQPLQTTPFGKHLSTNFVQKLHEKDPSGLALAEFLNMLQRSNPLERTEKIAKELPGFLAKQYPQGGSLEWKDRIRDIGYSFATNGKEITDFDLERIIEYINEYHENVFVPIFYTDPQNVVDTIARVSYLNQKNLSFEEREALDAYYKSRTQ